MKIFILDVKSKSREQMLKWLSQNKAIEAVEAFEDYIHLIEKIGKPSPDFCIIRLGEDSIPGLKIADMVRQTSPETKIVFVAEDRDFALDAYEVGAYGYLLCPVEKRKLENFFNNKKNNNKQN